MSFKEILLLLIFYLFIFVKCNERTVEELESIIYNNLTDSIDANRLLFDRNKLLCKTCAPAVTNMIWKRRVGKLSDRDMLIFLKTLCKALGIWVVSEDVCVGLVKSNYKVILYIIDNKPDLDANKVCAVLLQFKRCLDPPKAEWKIDIPTGETVLRKKGNPSIKPIKILHITDVHYDPLYAPRSNANCNKPLCCQIDSGDVKNPEDYAGYWTDYRSCDVPLYMIENTFDYIAKTMDIDYVYFTGDVISHRIWDTSIEQNTDDLTTFFNVLKRYLGHVPIFPTLGNHEPHPLNLFAPKHLSHTEFSTQWLFDLSLDLWEDLLPPETYNTIKLGGFYTTLVRPGFRIISLNNNVAYTLNYWILYEDEDTYGQLKWLAETLLLAEEKSEIVHILMHVPNGDYYTYVNWARQFARIIERFSNTITGIFYGHTHYAEMNVLYKENDYLAPINVGYNGGSITPFIDVNPNVRVFEVDQTNFEVLDFSDYIFNLTEANMHISKPLNWRQLYSFKSEYGVRSMLPEDISQLAFSLAENSFMRDKYYRNKVRYGEPSLKKGCDKECHQDSICNFVTTVFDDFRLCDLLLETLDK